MNSDPASRLEPKDFLSVTRRASSQRHYKPGEQVFAENDEPDFIYFIQSGRVSVSIQKFTVSEQVATLGPGDYFGELAVLVGERRTATVTAVEDSELLQLEKDEFLELLKSNPQLQEKINNIVAQRSEELALVENIGDLTGVNCHDLHIGIKGDPSLRESAFTRERYESVVDKELPRLVPGLKHMLQERSPFQICALLNSGEIRVLSVLDPFTETVHQSSKLSDKGYLDRHFPLIPYDEKVSLIRDMYGWLKNHPAISKLSGPAHTLYDNTYSDWQPVSRESIGNTLDQLPRLRSIPDFYLRHFTISMVRDTIRLQFNCDGTHIISSENYVRFLQDNLDIDWACET